MKTQALLTGLCLTAFPWAAALQSTPCCEGDAAPAASAQLAPVLEAPSALVALAPATQAALRPAQDARRGQIGVYLGGEGGQPTVESLVEGGAAQQAGIQAGDRIVALDGQAVASADELVRRVQGRKAGDRVRLTLERDGWRRELELTLAAPQEGGAPREAEQVERFFATPVVPEARLQGRLERIQEKLSSGGGVGGGPGVFRVERGDGPDVLRLRRAEAPQAGDEDEGERCCDKCGDCCGGGERTIELKGLGQGLFFGPGGPPKVVVRGEELDLGEGPNVYRWRSDDGEATEIEVEVQRGGAEGLRTRTIVVKPEGDGAPQVRVLEGVELKELKAGGGSWSTEDGGQHGLQWYRVEEGHDPFAAPEAPRPPRAPQPPQAGGGMRMRAPAAPGAPRMGMGMGMGGGPMAPRAEADDLQDLRRQLEELRDELRELRQSLRRARAEGAR